MLCKTNHKGSILTTLQNLSLRWKCQVTKNKMGHLLRNMIADFVAILLDLEWSFVQVNILAIHPSSLPVTQAVTQAPSAPRIQPFWFVQSCIISESNWQCSNGIVNGQHSSSSSSHFSWCISYNVSGSYSKMLITYIYIYHRMVETVIPHRLDSGCYWRKGLGLTCDTCLCIPIVHVCLISEQDCFEASWSGDIPFLSIVIQYLIWLVQAMLQPHGRLWESAYRDSFSRDTCIIIVQTQFIRAEYT